MGKIFNSLTLSEFEELVGLLTHIEDLFLIEGAIDDGLVGGIQKPVNDLYRVAWQRPSKSSHSSVGQTATTQEVGQPAIGADKS